MFLRYLESIHFCFYSINEHCVQDRQWYFLFRYTQHALKRLVKQCKFSCGRGHKLVIDEPYVRDWQYYFLIQYTQYALNRLLKQSKFLVVGAASWSLMNIASRIANGIFYFGIPSML